VVTVGFSLSLRAKRSSVRTRQKMDCFVASLLAMTVGAV
jgi:hypothetical protein